MIATFILSLHLLGFIAAPQAATFLYVCGGMLILAEIAFTVMGIFAFNGVLALYVAYALQSGSPDIFGLAIDWSLLFGLAFIEAALFAACLWIILRLRRRKISTGPESMIGTKAVIAGWEGHQGSVSVQGETWKARSENVLSLAKGDTVTIAAIDGLTLIVTVE